MQGRRVLITGGTAGIGKETARGLLRLGAEVVIVGRNPGKTRDAVEELKATTGNPQVHSLLADLSSLAEVRRLAAEYATRFPALHVLVNNAGGVNFAREVTVDGFERTFAVNHLAYYLLSRLLLPQLELGASARVVSVASESHRRVATSLASVRLDFDDLQATRRYRPFAVYSRSKLCNVLFTRELARRLAGRPITANCLHPGFVASEFLEKPGLWRLIRPVAYLFARDSVRGADTSVYLASAAEVAERTGLYFSDRKVRRPSRAAEDDAAARHLWAVSAELTGLPD